MSCSHLGHNITAAELLFVEAAGTCILTAAVELYNSVSVSGCQYHLSCSGYKFNFGNDGGVEELLLKAKPFNRLLECVVCTTCRTGVIIAVFIIKN
jgi:hypothetical protein